MVEVVGVSHECDFPAEENARPRGTLFPDGMGGSAVLLGSLGTRARGDCRRPRFVRPQPSALGASRLAGSNRRAPRNYGARSLRLRYQSCAARLRVAPELS